MRMQFLKILVLEFAVINLKKKKTFCARNFKMIPDLALEMTRVRFVAFAIDFKRDVAPVAAESKRSSFQSSKIGISYCQGRSGFLTDCVLGG